MQGLQACVKQHRKAWNIPLLWEQAGDRQLLAAGTGASSYDPLVFFLVSTMDPPNSLRTLCCQRFQELHTPGSSLTSSLMVPSSLLLLPSAGLVTPCVQLGMCWMTCTQTSCTLAAECLRMWPRPSRHLALPCATSTSEWCLLCPAPANECLRSRVQPSTNAELQGVLGSYLEMHACRGPGGRSKGADPRQDPSIDRKTAQRIISRRRTAATSKMRRKIRRLVSAVLEHMTGMGRAGALPVSRTQKTGSGHVMELLTWQKW